MKTAQERTSLAPGHTDVPLGHVPHLGPVDPASSSCRAVADILSRIGDKWTVLIVVTLGDGPKRFNEIKRLLNGISQRMLTLTLKGLERDGLVTRTVTPSIPPRVDYALTDLGRDLLGPVAELGAWARRHEQCIAAARKRFDESGRKF